MQQSQPYWDPRPQQQQRTYFGSFDGRGQFADPGMMQMHTAGGDSLHLHTHPPMHGDAVGMMPGPFADNDAMAAPFPPQQPVFPPAFYSDPSTQSLVHQQFQQSLSSQHPHSVQQQQPPPPSQHRHLNYAAAVAAGLSAQMPPPPPPGSMAVPYQPPPPPPPPSSRPSQERPITKLTVTLINTYKQINRVYYQDRESRRKTQPKVDTGATTNNGWDDENFDYIITEGEMFYGRYKLKERIGKGSFGQVVRAEDVQTQRDVAIKIIKSKRPFLMQAKTEIELLRLLSEKDPEDKNNIGTCMPRKRFSKVAAIMDWVFLTEQ
jgi:hypothetical protein